MKGTCKRKIFPPQPLKRGYAEKDGGKWIALLMAVLTVLICIPFQAAYASDDEFVQITVRWHGAEPTPIDIIVMRNDLGGYYEVARKTMMPTKTAYWGDGEWYNSYSLSYDAPNTLGAPFIAVSRSTLDGKWYCDKWDSNNWLYQPGQYAVRNEMTTYEASFFLTSSAPTNNSITVTHAWASGAAPVDTSVELYKYYSLSNKYERLSSTLFPAGQTSLTISGLYGGDYYVAHTYPACYSDNAPDSYSGCSATKATLSSGTAAAVPVTIKYTPPKYAVNIASTPGGTVSADKTQALEGETVTLTVTPGTDKRYKAGSLKYTDTLGAHLITGTSFTMPGRAVTVSAEFEPKQYTIGVAAAAGGLVTADKSSSASGQLINVTVTPDANKQLRSGTLKYSDSSGDHLITGGKFTMPQSNVIVSAEFEPKQYTIGITAAAGGLITADRSLSVSGQAVGVTVTPNAGKQLRPGTLKYTDSSGDHVITGGGFTMPQSNVTLSAQFETPVSIATGTVAGGMKGSAYAATVSAQDGWAPYQWSAGGLPDGLAIDQDTGEISGTPNKSGVFSLTLTVTDKGGTLAQRTLSLYIIGSGTDGGVLILGGYGGSITDNNDGTYSVAAAAAGYVIDQLWVDGSQVSAASGLKNYEVASAEKTIMATFAYTVNFQTPTNGTLAVTSAGGSIAGGTNVADRTVIHGGDRLNIMVSADTGFRLESLTVNGVDVTAKYDEANGYTFTVGGAATLNTGSARTVGNDTVGTLGANITAGFVPVPEYTATVAVFRDGSLWTAGAPVITIGTDSASALINGSAFANGTYHIYADGVDTGAYITVSGAAAEAALDYYTLTLTADTGIAGVSGGGVYLSGATANIDAEVLAGYTWFKWSDENTTRFRTIAITAATTLTATAAQTPPDAYNATVTVNKDGLIWLYGAPAITIGTAGTGAFANGSAFANGTYHIYADGIDTGVDITVSGEAAVAALDYYTLTLTAGPGIASVSGYGVYLSGAYANIDAKVLAGYAWLKWSDDSTVKFRTIAITAATDLTAAAAPAFVPVTGITGVPAVAVVGTDLPLFGTVAPENATNQAIEWSVRNAGITGASITGNTLSTVSAGTVTVTASIAGGASADMAYTQDFDITVHSNLIYRVLVRQASNMILQAEGLFTPTAELIVVPIKADKTEREELEALLSDKETVAAFEVHVTPSNAFQPPLSLHFQAGTQYNGRTVYILHRLSSGEVEQYTVVAANGEAVITVSELSPFLLAVDPQIIITSQPQNITVMAGQTAAFSVSAAGAGPITYQWQRKTGLSALWENIEGAVNPDHTTSQANLSNNGFQYRVIITDALGSSAASDAATLTVVQPPDTGDDSQPALYLMLMLVFMAFAILLLRKRRTVGH